MRASLGCERARILVVDDERGVADVLGALLDRTGASAAVVYGGRQAIAALEAEPFDLVLLDWIMPELPGWDAAATLRARWPGTKILVISGVAYRTIGEAKASGLIDGFLQKPFLMDALAAAITRILGKPRPAQAAA